MNPREIQTWTLENIRNLAFEIMKLMANMPETNDRGEYIDYSLKMNVIRKKTKEIESLVSEWFSADCRICDDGVKP